MRGLLLIGCAIALAACSGGESEPAEDAEAAGVVATPGAYRVTGADGSIGLGYLNADGSYYYVAEATGGGTWRATEDGGVCFTPPDGEENCGNTAEPVGEDGSFTVNPVGGSAWTARRLDKELAVGSTNPIEPQAVHGTGEDGSEGLLIWLADGSTTGGDISDKGTWRADGADYCSTSESTGTEVCTTNGVAEADGSWTSTPAEGDPYRVEKIL